MRYLKLIVGGIIFVILLAFMMFFGMQELGRNGEEKENVLPEQKSLKERIKGIPKTIVNYVLLIKEKESLGVPEELFTIQVASFQDKLKAERLAEELKKKGYKATISTKDLGGKGIWHRILVGDFDGKEEAAKFLQELKVKYKDSFVKSK